MLYRKLVLGLLFVAGAVALVACDSGGGTPTGTPTEIATPTVDTTVDFNMQTTGGIAGMQRVLAVSSTGDSKVTERGQRVGSARLSTEQVQSIVSAFQKADFFNLKDRYDSGTVADDIYRAVTYREGSKTKTVTVAEVGGKDITPQGLKDVIAKLTDLENQVKSAPTPR